MWGCVTCQYAAFRALYSLCYHCDVLSDLSFENGVLALSSQRKYSVVHQTHTRVLSQTDWHSVLFKPTCFTEEMLILDWSLGPLYHEYFCCVVALAKVSFTYPLWWGNSSLLSARMNIIIFKLSAKRWKQNNQYFIPATKMLISLIKNFFFPVTKYRLCHHLCIRNVRKNKGFRIEFVFNRKLTPS